MILINDVRLNRNNKNNSFCLWFTFLVNQISNSPLSTPPYHDNTHRQQPARLASANSQQQQNEQHLHLLSLGKSFFYLIRQS